MDCTKCQHLLAAYAHAVRLYTTAVRRIPNLAEADRPLAYDETEQLRRECLDADNSLRAHWRQDHIN